MASQVRLALSVVVVAFCGASVVGCDTYSTAEVDVRDPKYPHANAAAKEGVPLIVTGLDYARVKFNAVWVADQKLCGRQVGLGGFFGLYAKVPIAMVPIPGGHRGTIVLDQFLPGGCLWTFSNVDYLTAGQGGNALVENSLLVAGQPRPGFLPSPTPHFDFWCYQRIPKEFGTLPQPRCEDLASLRWPNAVRRVTAAFLSQLTLEQQAQPSGALVISPDTQEVTVTLHNLEAEPGAMEPPHKDGT